MTVSFDGVVLQRASKLASSYTTLTQDKLLLSGRHAIRKSTEVGTELSFRCLGTYSDVQAIVAKVGVEGTLTTEEDTITSCVISGKIEVEESDAKGYYWYKVSFVRDTS